MTCPIPELPGVGCLVPSATPSPTPAPEPSQSPTPTPTTTPYVPDESGGCCLPVGEAVPSPPALGGPVPVVEPPLVLYPTVTPTPTTTATASAEPLAAGVPLTSVVPSAYAIVVFGLIGVALLVSFLSGLKPSGGTMKATRTRLWAGLATIAAAAVVGGIGWYRVSGEPLLNRQIPFLASAGIAVIVLAVLGGALVVAEQLRADQNRIGELEDAVRKLTDALAPIVENAPRRSES